jgi:hypothetical protein
MSRRSRTQAFSAAVLVVLLAVAVPHLAAQSILTGDVVGTVTDPSGAVVSGATVTLSSVDTGSMQTAKTSSTGAFRFPLVKPGQYKLSVTAPGFRTTTQTVSAAVSAVTTANLQLTLGQGTETVEVSGAAPLIETENANISTTYNATQVENIPNGGNDITAYAYSAPGVLMNTSSGGGYGNFTAFGLPATSNLFTVNGNDEMDPYLNLNNSGATNLLLGASEVEEVGVTSNGYTGQYGRMAGAQVNYSTKSGTNNIHGALKYYYNDVSMNGTDWFLNNTNTKPGFDVNNQYAAQIGGPIVKDKLFFFIGTEGLRYVLATSNPIQVPIGSFSTPGTFENDVLANLASPAGANLPNSVPFYQQMFSLFDNAPGSAAGVPIGGAGGCGDLDGTTLNGHTYGTGGLPCAKAYRSTVGALSTEWLMYTKVDWAHTNNDRWSIRMKNDHGLQPTYTDYLTPAFNATSVQPAWEGQLSNTRTLSANLVNQFIGSVFWYGAIFQQSNATLSASTLPYAIYDLTGNWGNLATGTLLGGEQNVFPQGRNVTQYQLVDDVSLVKGNHNLKFGVNFRRDDITDATFGVRTIARARILALSDFVNGAIDQYSQRFPQKLEERINMYSIGFYGQDEWRVNPKLKLTLTLRLDRNSNATCPGKCFTRLATQFSQLNHDPTVAYSQMMHTGLTSAFSSVQAINAQPRIGFAYNIARNTVIRGGAGMFSDLYPATLVDGFAAQAPFDPTFTLTPQLLSPGEGSSSAAAIAANCNSSFQSTFASGGNLAAYQLLANGGATTPCRAPDFHDVVNHLKNPTYLEWNLELQHSIGTRSAISVNYVGNHGYDEFIFNDLANSRDTSGISGLPTAYPDLRIRNLQSLSNGSTSNYHGLTASFTQRAMHGLEFSVAYTYSHALDSVSNGGILPYSFNDSVGPAINPFNLKALNYGSGDNDIRHNINANYVWQIPTHYHGVMNQVLGGWIVSGTVFARSGYPFTMLDTNLAGVFGNSTGYAVGFSPLPTFVGGKIPDCTGHNQTTGCFGASPTAVFQSGSGGATDPVWDGTFGHTRRNTFRGPHYFNSDFSVLKNFKVTERVAFGVGANMYNVFNHPSFGNPFHDLAAGSLAGKAYTTVEPPTSPYGAFVGAAASGRIIQLHANLNF